MFQTNCTLPLSSELFTQVLHPTEPLLTIGQSSGHVECFRLPQAGPKLSPDSDGDASILSTASDGKGTIDSLWRTQRHKGSCRTLAYSPDGQHLYSAGTDALIKHFSPETGQVISKVNIPKSLASGGSPDCPSVLHILTPQNLLLACDSGALHFYDLRDAKPSAKPPLTHIPHDDYISSITPLPASTESTSGYPRQFVTTGGTTLAVIDIRKGVLARSEDQEDELLCATFVPGIGPKKARNNGMLATGTSSGVMTLWDRGAWDDQQDRIYVDPARTKAGGETVDAVTLVPDGLEDFMGGGSGKKILTALSNGEIKVVNLRTKEVEASLRHDDIDSAVALHFDCYNRLISGGGKVIKVWEEVGPSWEGSDAEGSDDDDNDDDDDDEDSDDDSEDNGATSKRKRAVNSDSDSDSDDVRRKKRGKNGKKANLGPHGAHGIMGFKDL